MKTSKLVTLLALSTIALAGCGSKENKGKLESLNVTSNSKDIEITMGTDEEIVDENEITIDEPEIDPADKEKAQYDQQVKKDEVEKKIEAQKKQDQDEVSSEDKEAVKSKLLAAASEGRALVKGNNVDFPAQEYANKFFYSETKSLPNWLIMMRMGLEIDESTLIITKGSYDTTLNWSTELKKDGKTFGKATGVYTKVVDQLTLNSSYLTDEGQKAFDEQAKIDAESKK